MERMTGKYLEKGSEEEVELLREEGAFSREDWGVDGAPSAPSLAMTQRQRDRNDVEAPSAPPLTQENIDKFVETSEHVMMGPRGKRPIIRSESNAEERGSENQSATQSFAYTMADFVDAYYSEGSIRGSIFNLCSATLGAGCLSVPFAFKGTGIGVGMLLLISVCIVTAFSVHLIIVTRQRSGLRNYGEIAEGVFGQVAAMVVELAVVVFCFGTGVAYCKTLRDILIPVIATVPQQFVDHVTDRQAMIALWVVALLPLSLIKSMASLRFSSLFGVLSVVYVAMTVTVHAIVNISKGIVQPKWHHKDLWFAGQLQDLLLALPIYLFAFTCQVNVLDVWDDLARASNPRMAKVTHRAMGLCLIIYACVGVGGFLEFGSKTCGNILQSYEDEIEHGSISIIAMYIFITLNLLMAFPLVVLPCRTSLMSLSMKTTGCSGGHIFWTLVVAGGALAISLWVEDVREVFQLVGASSSAFVCFIFPSAAALRLGILQGSEKYNAWALMIGGCVVAILATITTLQNITEPQKDPFCK